MSRLPQRSPSYREVLPTFPARQATPLDAKWAEPAPLSRDHTAHLITEAHADRARYMRAAMARAARMAVRPFLVLAASWRAWRVRQRDREELAQLDDRALRDIGISRYDARMAERRQFRRED